LPQGVEMATKKTKTTSTKDKMIAARMKALQKIKMMDVYRERPPVTLPKFSWDKEKEDDFNGNGRDAGKSVGKN